MPVSVSAFHLLLTGKHHMTPVSLHGGYGLCCCECVCVCVRAHVCVCARVRMCGCLPEPLYNQLLKASIHREGIPGSGLKLDQAVTSHVETM